MGGKSIPELRHWSWVAAFAAGYLALALLALDLARTSDGVAYVWPASGVAVAGLLLLGEARRKVLLVLVAAAGLGANYAYGSTLLDSAGFALTNIIEALIAVRFLRGGTSDALSFTSLAGVARFTGGAIVASVASAILATAVAFDSDPVAFFASWFTTVLLGIMIVTPTILTLFDDKSPAASTKQPKWRNAVVVLGVVGVTLVTFGQSELPLLFAPLVMVTFATYALGAAGAARSVICVAAIGIIATANGMGPATLVDGIRDQILYFQFYLLCLLASSLPLATLLADARLKDLEIRESKKSLEAAEQIAKLGNWQFNLDEETVRWSPEMFRIYGIPPRPTATRAQAIEGFHPDDRPPIAKALEVAVKTRAGFDFEGRIVRPDGSIRHVTGRGDVLVEDGKATGLFGIIHDVTERKLLLDELEAAKAIAENRAVEASRLADTDALTGVANRRLAMTTLNHEIGRASTAGTPLAIIILDVDHFKIINDTFGHAAGDQVLKRIAECCAGCLRPDDLFARIGGEEFLAILPGTDEQRSLVVAERLRSRVSELVFGREDEPEGVSISLGIATYQEMADETWLLQAADAALYRAKSAGRNRYILAA